MHRIYNLNISRIKTENIKFKSTPIPVVTSFPDIIDLRKDCPPIYDQGNLGSCTSNALAAAFYYISKTKFNPSRLFIYYNERKIEHSVKKDSGATLNDGINSLEKYGVCEEQLWPYIIEKFTIKPDRICYINARDNKVITAVNIIQELSTMKSYLVNNLPFVIGIAVYTSFENENVNKTGRVSLPNVETEQLLGGHAILIVGYNDNDKTFIFRNSWGINWGDTGYGYIPYDYITNVSLTSDLWCILNETNESPAHHATKRSLTSANCI